ncbi:external alternative NAD(P)H-ubiquinone oxidoreductase [Salix suchowensis]|nr:external alternative NAD(P)H-ubiquinone oxidoreductase [Salix suchowensis]
MGNNITRVLGILNRDKLGLVKRLLVIPLGGGLLAFSDAKAFQSYAEGDGKKKKVVVLGTGWAGVSFLKNLKSSSYDVHIVSPRNYFAFTPLLPSVTNGTVEGRSIVEPIRNIAKKKPFGVEFKEAECYKIDPAQKKIYCRSTDQGNTLGGNEEFTMDYDVLIVAMGAKSNTFNTPGVEEHAHFLKRKRIMHFVVVGGGPTGVEYAAELHDFAHDDLAKLYPSIKDYLRITLLEAGDHILNMFDSRITKFATEKFVRDGIDVKTGSMEIKTGQTVSIPYGMVLWSTGIATRPVIMDFMKQIGQGNRRVLATDEWLRVEGCDGVYALGDCATINQRKVMEDIAVIFSKADKNNSGTLDLKDFKDVVDHISERYPQVQIYMEKKKLKTFDALLKSAQGNDSKQIDIETFKNALHEVDSQMKNLPATAQVAAQQGEYLANCFNRMEQCEKYPEGPMRFRGIGRHRFHPFRYKHFGQFAPLGGEQTAAQLPGDWISVGYSTQWLWYAVYTSKLVSWRTRVLVVSDWLRRSIFGRDSSRI